MYISISAQFFQILFRAGPIPAIYLGGFEKVHKYVFYFSITMRTRILENN